MKSITITIALDAEPIVEAHGFAGCGCTEATKAYEEALGAVTKRTKKAEFHQTVKAAVRQTLNRGER